MITVKDFLKKLHPFCEPIIYIIHNDCRTLATFTNRKPNGDYNEHYRKECTLAFGDYEICDNGIEMGVDSDNDLYLDIRVKCLTK